jgi:hypothetical protein
MTEDDFKSILNTARLVDREIENIANNNPEQIIKLHEYFIMITTVMRIHNLPIEQPGFSDMLRLASNIIDIAVTEKKKNSN